MSAKYISNSLKRINLRHTQDFVNIFSLFRNYLRLEKVGALHLNKLESPSPKDALCQVWSKLTQSFWKRRFLNAVNVFSLFRNYPPLEKGGALQLNKLETPSPNDEQTKIPFNQGCPKFWLKLVLWSWKIFFF